MTPQLFSSSCITRDLVGLVLLPVSGHGWSKQLVKVYLITAYLFFSLLIILTFIKKLTKNQRYE